MSKILHATGLKQGFKILFKIINNGRYIARLSNQIVQERKIKIEKRKASQKQRLNEGSLFIPMKMLIIAFNGFTKQFDQNYPFFKA